MEHIYLNKILGIIPYKIPASEIRQHNTYGEIFSLYFLKVFSKCKNW